MEDPLHDLITGKAFERTRIVHWPKPDAQEPQDILEPTVKRAAGEVMESLGQSVAGGIKDPREAEQAAQAKLAEFESMQDALRQKYGTLAQKVQVELVARRLERAAA